MPVPVPRDDRTPRRDYLLPHVDNPQRADVARLRDTLGAIDTDMAALDDALLLDLDIAVRGSIP